MLRLAIGILIGAAIGLGGAWIVFEEPFASGDDGPSEADAAALARREALKRERGKWTVPVEVRGTDCDRTGDEYECAVAVSVPRPDGGEAFVTLAIYNDAQLVVRNYTEPVIRLD